MQPYVTFPWPREVWNFLSFPAFGTSACLTFDSPVPVVIRASSFCPFCESRSFPPTFPSHPSSVEPLSYSRFLTMEKLFVSPVLIAGLFSPSPPCLCILRRDDTFFFHPPFFFGAFGAEIRLAGPSVLFFFFSPPQFFSRLRADTTLTGPTPISSLNYTSFIASI